MRKALLATTMLAALTGLAVAQSGPAANQSGGVSNAPAASRNDQSAQPKGATSAQQGGTMQSQGATAAQDGKANQAGIRQVDAASLRLTFYAVQPADMRASKLIGTDVYNLNNEKIGEVEDLIIDNGKNVKGVVVSIGGFLGIGDRNVAVQPGSVVLSEQSDGAARMVINTTKEDLKNAPAFNFADVDKAGSGAATTGQRDNAADKGAGKTGGSAPGGTASGGSRQ
jgi:sporulation protein YlmC with PRC-barrel domain